VVFSGGARAEQEQSEIVSEKLTIMVGSGNLLAENNVKTNVKTESTSPDSPGRVFIDSDFQQYDKASDTMLASGNVRIRYGDYRAAGPKATFKMKGGGVDKIFITGRANIITNGRQVEADKIVITTSPKHFDAVGNVKSKFLAKSVDPTPSSSSSGGPSKLPPNSKKPAATAATSQPPDPKAPPDEKRPDDDYLD
jgi:lipopolysaccharide export system protein LptA